MQSHTNSVGREIRRGRPDGGAAASFWFGDGGYPAWADAAFESGPGPTALTATTL